MIKLIYCMSTHSKTRNLIWVLIVLVSIITISGTIFAYSFFRNQTLNSLNKRVTSFAVALSSQEIKNLSGTEEDLTNPSYISLKEKLVSLQNYNDDTRFIYLMGKNDKGLFFYADSEPDTSEDYSPPGQVYDEASEIMFNVFSEKVIQTEVGEDRWGKWLSVMSPVIDPENGQVIALVGFDIPYQDYNTEILISTLLPLSVGLLIIIFLFASLLYAKKDEQILRIRSEYFAIAAHDLRAPLTGIKWAIESLKKLAPDQLAKKSPKLLEQIGYSSENMLASLTELLDGASLDKTTAPQLSLTDVDVNLLLQLSYQPLEIAAKEKKLSISWNLSKPKNLRADKDKLRRVFSNLISNAIKYSNPSGQIEIITKYNKKYIIISITDHGIGIPKSEQNKVFSGYYRASNAKEHTAQGTGLGLYYVKNIIAQHDGVVNIESEPGMGTKIVIQLPLP